MCLKAPKVGYLKWQGPYLSIVFPPYNLLSQLLSHYVQYNKEASKPQYPAKRPQTMYVFPEQL